MDYRRFGNTVIVRIDKGEEILCCAERIAEKEKIRLAQVHAIGAVGSFTVGVFRPAEKKYEANSFQGDFEICSLTGTVSRMDGRVYCHFHMSAGDGRGQVFGGHLNRAVVSATCEMVMQQIDGQVNRRFSEEIGLNLFDF